MAGLTDAGRDEIVRILTAGEDLPGRFKHMLFPPERQECELVYAGKEREEDILADTWGVPLQAIKTFSPNGPGEWHNRLIFGDNLQAMKTLLDDPDVKGKVKLVYIDPPFATRQEFRGSQNQRAYQDKIAGAKFVEFLRKRLVLIHRLLSEDGALFVHLDTKKSHYMKVILDQVFGEGNFRNEIIWKRQSAHSDASQCGAVHDSILFYTKTARWVWNVVRTEVSGDYKAQFFDQVEDGTGRRYARADLTAAGITQDGDSGKSWRGIDPSRKGRHWAFSPKLLDRLDAEGRIHWPKKGVPRLKRYADEVEGVTLQDVWTDVKIIHNQSAERVGYPTQKPEALAARIISACSNPGDIVLDAFAGSGTTCAVAEKLGRRWIGIDCGKLAIYTIQKRMLSLRTKIGNAGEPLKAKPFTLYNAGLYDYQRLRDLPWDQYRRFALQLFQVRDEPHELAGVSLDGFKGGDDVLVFDFTRDGGTRLDEGYIDDLHTHIGEKARDNFFIIAPAGSVEFLEDYFDRGETRYYVLRIPYSIIDELHERDFEQITQPTDEADVNNTVEAVGFDFIQPPEVKCAYAVKKPKGQLYGAAAIKIKRFVSRAMTKRPITLGNRESLSMVMVDYDYDRQVFDLDEVFYANDLAGQGWEIRLDPSEIRTCIMVIYMDIFGNEYRETKTAADFGIRIKTDDPSAKVAAMTHAAKKLSKSLTSAAARSGRKPSKQG